MYQIGHNNPNTLSRQAKMTMRETIQKNPDHWVHFSFLQMHYPSAFYANSDSQCLSRLNPCFQYNSL